MWARSRGVAAHTVPEGIVFDERNFSERGQRFHALRFVLNRALEVAGLAYALLERVD